MAYLTLLTPGSEPSVPVWLERDGRVPGEEELEMAGSDPAEVELLKVSTDAPWPPDTDIGGSAERSKCVSRSLLRIL